jgi:hypothetical protein
MVTNQLVFEGQTFQIASRSLVATCELFLEKSNLLSTPCQARSQVSETSFRVFLATTEIGIGNALDPESLTKEFQFVELGRQVAEFLSQPPRVDVIWLKSAIADLEGHLAGQDRELCQLTEADGRARAEQDSQPEALRGATDEVAKEQRHERKKVSGLRQAMGEVRHQMNQTAEAVGRRWDWRRRRLARLGSNPIWQVCGQ